jgi:hypothetical protein
VSLVFWFLFVTKNDLYGGQQEKQVNWPLLAIGVERKREKTKVTTSFSFGNNREFREKKKSSFLMFPSK